MNAMKPMEPMKPMQPMKPMEPMKPMQMNTEVWWPSDLGKPSSAGSQNDTRYAYFDSAHRLAVDAGGKVTVYDTANHRINGFGQQQSQGNSMTFQSDDGPVVLSSLKLAN